MGRAIINPSLAQALTSACALFGWEEIQEARNLPAFVGSHRAVRRDYSGVVHEVEAAAKSVGGCDMADGLGSDRTEGECADLGRHSIFWRACCQKIVIVCLHKNLLPTNLSRMNCRGSSGPGRLKQGVASTPAQNKPQLHYTLFLKAPCAMLMFQHAREPRQLQLLHDSPSGIMAGKQTTPRRSHSPKRRRRFFGITTEKWL